MKVLSLVFLAALTACAPVREKTVVKPEPAPIAVHKPVTVSDYMTAQENEIKALLTDPAFQVKRRKNFLIITLAGPKVFAPNSYRVEEPAAAVLKKLAVVFASYEKTRISIFGYTQNTGKPSTNQLLSDKRADAAAAILESSANIADVRFWIEGKGISTDNRIDIVLMPTFR